MQEAMQKFGRFLSAMVMPNIGAFIAWGFITALFIPAGWIPNEGLAELVPLHAGDIDPDRQGGDQRNDQPEDLAVIQFSHRTFLVHPLSP